MSKTRTVTIFGSSLPVNGSPIYLDALRLGKLLAEAGFAICNGGYGGLMEASARGAYEAGGHTIGVTCNIWTSRANPWIREEVRTGSFEQRLMTLIARGDAYIALPGGTGTLAELALVWEMMNKSSLSETVGGQKPLLVMASYWKPVIACLEQETQLVPGEPEKPPVAMKIITLVDTVDEMAEILRRKLRS
ncbi:MAG TPA: LOG family protein [Terriglobia bacterium]|nr:LOG family protein [Terriglobia bacterium]